MVHHAFNFQGNAVFGVLAFLAAGFGTFVGLAAAAALLWFGRRRLAGFVLLALGAGACLYSGALLAFSLSSHEEALAAGEEKYFCEVDCHLAYSVLSVEKTRTLGPAVNPTAAQGMFYVVTVRTRFDEKTIGPRRGNAPLTPNPRQVLAVDESGRTFVASPEGQKAWEQAGGQSTPITQTLRPGESYKTTLVFDLPVDARNPRLLITESDGVTRLLVGHENSFLHKRTFFRLAF